MTIALIDADIIAFRAAALADGEDPFEPGQKRKDMTLGDCEVIAKEQIAEILTACKTDQLLLIFSPDDRKNFRKSVSSSYKQSRNPGGKPRFYWELVNSLRNDFRCNQVDGMEGDDLLGIFQTGDYFEDTIIVSSDKDMHTIPGRLYNHVKREFHDVSTNQANWYWMYQSLMGDSTDGYGGAPGYGRIKAERLLPTVDDSDPTIFMKRLWYEVQLCFIAAYDDEKIGIHKAIKQARLARILRNNDYNWERKAIRLWHPTEDIWYPVSQI
jgi:5'-3' exonuclease